MDTSIAYQKSPLGPDLNNMNIPHWKEVAKLFEQKKHKDSIIELLNYIDKDVVAKYQNEDQSKFSIPHGSVVLDIELTDTEIRINAPFVKLPVNASVPVLRRVAELNFVPLKTAQIVLNENEELTFKFKSPLEAAEPFNLYNTMYEICSNADLYDDFFIAKFGASHLREPKVKRFSSEELDNAWSILHTSISELEQYIEYFEQNRWGDFIYNIGHIFLLKVDYCIAPQGQLRNEFGNALAAFTSNTPFNDRVHRLKQFIEKLKAMDRANFDENLYQTETFVPYKHVMGIIELRNRLRSAYTFSKGQLQLGNGHMGVCLSILMDIYSIFYTGLIEEKEKNILVNGIQNADQKPWEEAATILFSAIESIVDEEKFLAIVS